MTNNNNFIKWAILFQNFMTFFSKYSFFLVVSFFSSTVITDDGPLHFKLDVNSSPSSSSPLPSGATKTTTGPVMRTSKVTPKVTTRQTNDDMTSRQPFSLTAAILSTFTTTTTAKPAPVRALARLDSVQLGKSTNFPVCPKDNEAPFQLFPTLCKNNSDCKGLSGNQICCKIFGNKRCVEGKINQPEEPKHDRK